MRVLIYGPTGSGKTEYVINKTKEYVDNFHRVFHIVPLLTLKKDVYNRYNSKYQGLVSYDLHHLNKINVLTYNEYNQLLVLKEKLFYDVIVFDEYHVIYDTFFKKVVYSAIVNTDQYFVNYFISATPEKLPFIKFDKVIEIKPEKYVSRYTKKRIYSDKEKYDIIKKKFEENKVGFVYTGTIAASVFHAINISKILPIIDNDDYDTDDPILSHLLKHGVAYINSSLSDADRKLVLDMINDKTIKVFTTTTSINYGIDLDIDYAIFNTYRFLDKIKLIQFYGRVGRRNNGEIYLMFDEDRVTAVPEFTLDSDTEDFARLIAHDNEYICKKYPDLCNNDIIHTVAYHLLSPKDAVKVINLDLRDFDDPDYMLCVTNSLARQGYTLDIDPLCNDKYGINADREEMELLRSWIRLDKVQMNGKNKRIIDNNSYFAHIIGVLKNIKYDDLSISIKFGIPYNEVKDLIKLIELPYIGRYRAYLLYKNGITRENICYNTFKVKTLIGKIADKITSLICNHTLITH